MPWPGNHHPPHPVTPCNVGLTIIKYDCDMYHSSITLGIFSRQGAVYDVTCNIYGEFHYFMMIWMTCDHFFTHAWDMSSLMDRLI